MASSNGSKPPADNAFPDIKINVLGQFIDDLSFENIAFQQGRMNQTVESEIEVQVGVDVKKTIDQIYHVVIRLKLSAVTKKENEALFILELDYVGMFNVPETDEETLKMVLMVECPRLLFPFVRRIASNLTQDAGFPPVNLDPIDFLSLYRGSAVSEDYVLN
ncbi:MAG: protein-export chaperone SecB [Paracoccaceae bacterium]|nr:protein-export chaperone SecB [Paracoccaceae bacterium]MDE2675020.1 protein-export chaperone SecB [Paracoccaceae bacterium]MDE2739545.1 protein-export chaperone SecB [Paracoccaceae bacterium]